MGNSFVWIRGNMVREAEVRFTATGKAVATCTIAVNKQSTNGNKYAAYIPVVGWEEQANALGVAGKGQYMTVIGELSTRSYEGKDGIKRFVMEVIARDVIVHSNGFKDPGDEEIPF